MLRAVSICAAVIQPTPVCISAVNEYGSLNNKMFQVKLSNSHG